MVLVPFQGDQLEAVHDGAGDVWVVLKRVCENLGIADNKQALRLKKEAWAVTTVTVVTGPDGKNYKTLCLHLDTVPIWLGTIDASRAKVSIRPKLIAYQKECAKALRDYFFGKVPPAPRSGVDVRDTDDRIAAALERIGDAFVGVNLAVATINVRLEALERERVDVAKLTYAIREGVRQDAEARAASDHGIIDDIKSKALCALLQDAARMRAQVVRKVPGEPSVKEVQKSRGVLEMRLRDVVEHSGPKSAWRLLPLHKEAKALRFIAQMRDDYSAMFAALNTAPSPQTTLFKGDKDQTPNLTCGEIGTRTEQLLKELDGITAEDAKARRPLRPMTLEEMDGLGFGGFPVAEGPIDEERDRRLDELDRRAARGLIGGGKVVAARPLAPAANTSEASDDDAPVPEHSPSIEGECYASSSAASFEGRGGIPSAVRRSPST